MSKNWLVCFFIFLLTVGCETDHKLSFSIFHWKTKLKPSQVEKTFLSNQQIRKIYLRYFDVKIENGFSKPKLVSEFQAIDNKEYVPCVYLVNSIFKGLSKVETLVLARNMGELTDIEASNSILNPTIAHAYKKSFFTISNSIEYSITHFLLVGIVP